MKFPLIEITGDNKCKEVTFGLKVSIDGQPIPAVQKAVVEFGTEEYATVTLTLAGGIFIPELKTNPSVVGCLLKNITINGKED